MGEIMESDKQVQRDYEAAREETEEVKAQYEAEKSVYEERQTELRGEQAELRSVMDKGEQLLYALQDEIETAIAEWENAQAAEEAAAATIANVIASYNARKASERAAEQAAAQQAVEQVKQQITEMMQTNLEAVAAGYEPVYSEQQIQQLAQEAEVGYVAGSQSSG